MALPTMSGSFAFRFPRQNRPGSRAAGLRLRGTERNSLEMCLASADTGIGGRAPDRAGMVGAREKVELK